ncbi:MAG: hypothetical protein ATN35_01760, partial [Epulopiscium sp. Nele67-Bin004]
MNIQKIVELVKENRYDVFVYSAWQVSENIITLFSELGEQEYIKGFCDIRKHLEGTEVRGQVIYSLEQCKEFENPIIIIPDLKLFVRENREAIVNSGIDYVILVNYLTVIQFSRYKEFYLPTKVLNKVSLTSQIKISNQEENLLKEQYHYEQLLEDEYSKNKHTFENPYIKIDPYDMNPLSAIIKFRTEQPCQVAFKVLGEVPVEMKVKGFNTEHEIPVFGLYEDAINSVEITKTEQIGGEGTTAIIEMITQKLDRDFDIEVINNSSDEQYMMYVGVLYNYYWMDTLGNVRLHLKNVYHIEHQFSTLGIQLAGGERFTDYSYYYPKWIMNMMYTGKITKINKMPYGVHHDFIILPSKNILLASNGDNGNQEDVILEIDFNTGKIIDIWDMSLILDKNRIGILWTMNLDEDWLHINSLYYDEIEDAIIMSGKHQGIISINKTTKKLNWILSDPTNWQPKFHKYLLKPIGNDFEYPYIHHSAVLSKDRNLIIFDNGIYRSLDKKVAFDKDRVEYSRGVEYKMDIENMTVEQVWQFGKERGKEWFAYHMSSIQELPNNNRLICSASIRDLINGQVFNRRASVVEVNSINNEIMREFKINNAYCNRAKRIDIPSEVENTPLATEILYDDYFEEHPTNIHINKNHYLHIENVNELVSDEQLQTELGIRA